MAITGVSGTGLVKSNIRNEFNKKQKATYALCLYYSGVVIREFRQRQSTDSYWMNQTNLAKDTVFSNAFYEEGGLVMGFFLAHAVQYGVYLELANDRKHEALRPIINEYLPEFRKRLEKIYA